MFIVVVSTTWWASSLESAEEWSAFNEAVDDVRWVLEQLLKLQQPALSTPDPPMLSKDTQKPVSKPNWMARSSGKRQPKPSRKIMEGA